MILSFTGVCAAVEVHLSVILWVKYLFRETCFMVSVSRDLPGFTHFNYQ